MSVSKEAPPQCTMFVGEFPPQLDSLNNVWIRGQITKLSLECIAAIQYSFRNLLYSEISENNCNKRSVKHSPFPHSVVAIQYYPLW